MKLIPLLMVFTGVLLIYSAHQDRDPRNVIFEALKIDRRIAEKDKSTGRITGGGTFGTPSVAPTPNYPTTTPGVVTVSV